MNMHPPPHLDEYAPSNEGKAFYEKKIGASNKVVFYTDVHDELICANGFVY